MIPGPAALAALLVIAPAGRAPLESNDVFFHLASGRWILEHGGFPSADPFSPTATAQVPHEWVWGVICELSIRALGGAGPKLLVAAIVAAFFALLWKLMSTGPNGEPRPTGLVQILLFGAALSTQAFTWHQERPYHLAHLTFAAWLLAVRRWRLERSSRWAAAVIGLSWLWANLHGSWVLGPVFLGATVLIEFLDEPGAATHRSSVLVVLATIAVAALHPSGLSNLTYPLKHQLLPSTQTIEEWAPLQFSFGFAWVLVGLLVWGVVLLSRRAGRRAGPLIIPALLLTAAAFWSRRHAPFAGVALTTSIAALLVDETHDGPADVLVGRWAQRANGLIWAALLWVALTAQAFAHPRTVRESLDEGDYPLVALDELLRRPPGRVLAKFEWGSLVSAMGGPPFQTFIDSRNDPYPAQIHDGYRRMRTLKPEWKAELDAFHPDYVLWGGTGADFSWPLVWALESEGWHRVAGDDVGVLLVRP